MRRDTLDIEIPEISVTPTAPSADTAPPAPSWRSWLPIGLVLALLVVGAQLIGTDSDSAPNVAPTAALPDPAPVTTSAPSEVALQATELPGEFTWTEVEGLDRFESVTPPTSFDDRYVTIGNPSGVSGSASVMVSNDGTQWNRIGTIHGIGGEIQIVDLDVFLDRLIAVGTYTDGMPVSDAEPRYQAPAAWYSTDGIDWERVDLSDEVRAFVPHDLVVGSEAALVTGGADWMAGLVPVYESLPAEIRAEVASGRLQMVDPDGRQTFITAGPIRLMEVGRSEPVDYIQRVFRTGDGVAWEEVPPPSGFGHYSLTADGQGQLVAYADNLTTHTSRDGLDWSPSLKLPLAGWVTRGPGGTLVSITFDVPYLRIWNGQDLHAVRLNRGLRDRIRGVSSTSESITILQFDVPVVFEEPRQVTAGEYNLTFFEGALMVADETGTEVGRWRSRGYSLVDGEFDPETGMVVLMSDDGQVLLPPDPLPQLWGWQNVTPQAEISFSSDGVTWRTADVPSPGDASLVGPIGSQMLVHSLSPPVENLWPVVNRYLLVSP